MKTSDCFDQRREIICTPILGCYGGVSQWVITINGTPPRGTLMLRADVRDVGVFFDNWGSRCINRNSKLWPTIQEFVAEFISKRNVLNAEPFSICERVAELVVANG